MSAVALVALAGLAVAAVLSLVRLVLGPSVPDRVVALDNLLLCVVAGIAVGAADSGRTEYLGVLVAVSLLGFVGTVTVGRYVERRGAQ